MNLNNTQQYKNFQDFEKYAQFICQGFDINVVLDSTRAETDGKVIYLPNVMSMTAKELDMMYAILLHEAGHIRYSTFDEKYFKALKSQSHAFLANAIEDGRIENLLMKDFGGARDMFENLYCNYTQDKVLMRKVFKHDGQKPDLFTTLAFYTHNKIVDCETASLREIAGPYRAGRIIKFWKDNNLDGLIASNALKTDEDVITLTNKIYDLFATKFKDKSEKLDFNADVKQKDDIAKKLVELKKEAFEVEKKVIELGKKIEETQQKITSFEEEHEPEISALQNKIDANNITLEKIDSQINFKNTYDRNTAAVVATNANIEKITKEVQKLNNELKILEDRLHKGVTGRGKKPMSPEQKDALQKRVDAKQSQTNRMQQKLDSYEVQGSKLQQALQEADIQASMHPEKYDKYLDIDKKVAEKEAMHDTNQKIQSEINEINSEKNEMIKEFNSYVNQIEKLQSDFMEKAAETMFNIDKMSGVDFDLDIMPELNYEDVWPEAANVQESFDKDATSKTGKIVRNGQKAAGLFGSNIRDILTYIDKAKEKVDEINIVEVFKGKISTSKLDDFNSEMKEKNHMEDKSVVGVFGTYREHIPLTTMYDSIKKENIKNDKSERTALMQKNNIFYRDLKRVFAKKFKFAKKDFWKGNQEEGNLDARNLWRLPTNQGDDYYEVSKPKFVNKAAATILVDISGSQSKEATDFGKKIQELVLGISIALDEVHIKHEILGYHAPICEEMRETDAAIIYTRRSNKLETIIYKEAVQKDNNGIMNIETQMTDNSDGESLRIAMKRLKAIKAKSHLLFIISDGKPFLSDTDISVLDEDLRTALRLAVKEKIQVVGLGFFDQLEHFFGNRFCNATKNEDVINFFDKTYFQV